MKILIADKFQESGLAVLNEQFQCHYDPGLKNETLVQAMTDHNPEILVVRSTKVREPVIQAGQGLKLIIRAGAGVDNIDIPCAANNGVYVANCPGKNAIAVAELTMGLILNCDRRLPDQWGDLQKNRWNKKHYAKARGLYGLTLGLIGFGTIAQEVASRAKAFGLNVVAWSRSLNQQRAEKHGVTAFESPIEVAQQSDIVSVHLAATAQTKNFIDARFLNAMKANSYFINTSRGSVVDEAELIKAIETKSIRAGLDVFQEEPNASPSEWDKGLCKLPGVYSSHHIGASTDQAQDAIANETVRICQGFALNGEVINCLNQQRVRTEKSLITVRHKNEPGVLAAVFQVLANAHINVENMENRIYQGGQAACARIPVASQLNASVEQDIRKAHKAIISVDVKNLE